MKVFQLITRNELRGAEMFASQLSSGLALRGHQIELSSIYRPRQGQSTLPIHPSVTCACLEATIHGKIEWAALRTLIRRLKTLRPDVVQANAFHALKYLSLARRITRSRWPIIYRNISIASRWITRPWQRAWGRWLLKPVDRVTSVSDSSALDFCHTYRIPHRRATTIRRGIPIPDQIDRQSARRHLAHRLSLPSHDDWQAVIHIGGFTPEKNHRGLLQAFEQIVDRHPRVHLVLCGDGPLRHEVAREIAQHRYGHLIHQLGDQVAAADLITGTDLLLLPSDIEGIPGVVLEASARSVPSIATRVGGMVECIDDGRSGLLVERGDMMGLASHAVTLLKHDDQRSAMGAAARELVELRFGMNRCLDEFEALYDEVAS